jgi:hypothetical protein
MPLFTIPCSFGEIIDKITILEIKLTKSSGPQKANIQAEFDGLKSHLRPTLPPEKLVTFSKNLDELRAINKRLWALEDLIRQKSSTQAHDGAFIQVAEAIHKTNDERYRVKRILNGLMDSRLVEEKIYERPESIESKEDQAYFVRAMRAFESGNYDTSFRIFEKLCEKFKNEAPSTFMCSLLSSYDTNATFLGVPNKYLSLMDKVLPLARDIVTDDAHRKHILMNYGMHLMRRKEYGKATEYLRYMNAMHAPGITPETMSLPPSDGKGATMLVYMGGGIGDKIMFARFIPLLCEALKESSVIFLVDDSLYWIFSQAFKEPNLKVVPFSKRSTVTFSHHCNIHMLPHFLGLEYEDILPLDYLSIVRVESPIQIEKGKTVLINWHGNYANQLERLNRGVALESLKPLFAMKQIRWISTQKEFSPDEHAILKEHNILNLGPLVDNDGDSYKDTLAIMRQVDLVISTDTSFVHVAGTAGIPCWVLLTKGCEWRWTQDKISRWYPSMRLFRQNKVGDWSSVVSDVQQTLSQL